MENNVSKMMKLVLSVIGIMLLMVFSLWLNNWTTPDKTDKEYIAQYRVLHATNMTDAAILEDRAKDIASATTWTHTNKMLANELEKRNIETGGVQSHLDQILFHTQYQDNNVTVEKFVDSQYPEK